MKISLQTNRIQAAGRQIKKTCSNGCGGEFFPDCGETANFITLDHDRMSLYLFIRSKKKYTLGIYNRYFEDNAL